jgi:hypothetical protein
MNYSTLQILTPDKNLNREQKMDIKEQWTVETAMKILQHKTVDSKLWADAVEWLILHGPQDIRNLLLQSSGTATSHCFPNLKASGYAPDGQPCYHVAQIAGSLQISEEEAKEIIARKQEEHGMPHFIDETEVQKVQ